MNIHYLLIIFCLGLALPGSAQDELTEEILAVQRNLIEANKYFLLEHDEDALTAYRNVLSKDRANAPAYYGISRVYLRQNALDEAEKNILTAIEHDNGNIWYYEHLIQIRSRQKDIRGKAEALEQVILVYPEIEKFYIELSQCYDQLKDYKKALKALEPIEGKEVDPMISYRKARLYAKMNKPERAVKEYQRMIDANEGDTRYLHMLAAHYRSTGEEVKSIEIYKKILELDPDDSRAGLAVANQARLTGNDLVYLTSIGKIMSSTAIDIDTKIKELLPFVQKMTAKPDEEILTKLEEYASLIIELHPNDAKGHALGADIEQLRGNKGRAIERYAASLALKQSVFPVWEQYLFLLMEMGRITELANESERALDYFPNRGRLYYFLAYAHVEQIKYEEAASELEQARIMSGRDQLLKLDVFALQGKVYYHLADHSAAIRSFEEAMRISPENDNIKASFAYVLAQTEQDLDKALTMSEQAYNNASDRPSFILAYAWALARNHRQEAALEIIESVENIDAQSSEYIERYGDILFLMGRTDDAVVQWQKALAKGSADSGLSEKITNRSIVK